MEAHMLINNQTLKCFFEALWIVKGWREEVPISGLISFVAIVIWRTDSEGRVRNTKEIAELSGVDYTTFLRFVRELEMGRDKISPSSHTDKHKPQEYRRGGPTRGGLIKRKQDPFDRRNNIIELTQRGERLAQQIIHAVKGNIHANQAALGGLPSTS
jgi:DNA-binding MarR family transcriptional regulator